MARRIAGALLLFLLMAEFCGHRHLIHTSLKFVERAPSVPGTMKREYCARLQSLAEQQTQSSMGEVFDFRWDEVFLIVNEYSTGYDLERATGYEFEIAPTYNIEFARLAFFRDGQQVFDFVFAKDAWSDRPFVIPLAKRRQQHLFPDTVCCANEEGSIVFMNPKGPRSPSGKPHKSNIP